MALTSLSSSSTTTDARKHDVFLSFRGKDTRKSFTSHLDAALRRRGIDVFIDDQLRRGDEISPSLLEAIEGSIISIVVLSEHYASSAWCLDELVKILDCKEKNNQVVVPVFYNVDLSDVRKQKGSFDDAFVVHEKRFRGDEGQHRVARWRAALTEVANLSGWVSSVTRPESRFVENIVEAVSKELIHLSPSNDIRDFVGLNPRIQRVKSLLNIEMLDSRIIGIWGMGGIGKTTIAEAIFNQIPNDQFDATCFISNVGREVSKTANRLFQLRDKLLATMLDDKYLRVGTRDIPRSIKDRLQRKKVFIILDDVDNSIQLDFLVGDLDRFKPGSRIIITTRDKQLLHNWVSEDHIYKVEEFNHHEALQLFSHNAFKQNHPTEDLMVLSNKLVNHARGNPLALKILGSALYGNNKQEWTSALGRLQRMLNSDIYDVLKISYDGLEYEEKGLFLDVACFFQGEDKDHVTDLAGDSHYSLSVLIDKSLITLSGNKLQMHDLLLQTGRQIVHQESSRPHKRSRLWNHEEILSTLTNDTGTAKVEGISLDMSMIKDVELNSLAFKKMKNLRFLRFYDGTRLFGESKYISKVHLPYSLDYLSNELRLLHWVGYPSEELPSNFNLENVVELSLPCSKLKRLWTGEKHAPKLKRLNLPNCRYLTELPDLSYILNLETINLEYCSNLLGIPRCIEKLYNLTILSLKGCENIRSFPDNIYFKSLISLDLSQCVNLTKFPQLSGDMMKKLYLSGTAIEEVPSSIESLAKLVELRLQRCTRLKSVSSSICKLKILKKLDLSDCCRLEIFPEISETMEALTNLDLSGTAIKEIDPSIELLKGLSQLFFNYCENLETLPGSICNIECLIELQLSDCSKLVELPENVGNLKFLKIFVAKRAGLCQLPSSLTGLKNLETLDCSECRSLEFPPASVLLRSLHKLYLNDCNLTNISPDIGCLSSLEVLELCGNDFESLPKSIKQLSQLKTLALNRCSKLLRLLALPLALQELKAMNCKQLQSLPDSSQFRQLVTERCTRGDPVLMRLVFINCLELNQKSFHNVLAELQLLIGCMATTSLVCCEKGYQKAVDVSICYPGSEIPESFIFQNAGSSVDIPLASINWGDSRFMGFVVCAIIAFEENYNDCRGLRVYYKCNFETNDGDKFECISSLPICDDDMKSVELDHVIIGYDVYSDVKLLMDKFTAGTFEFFPEKDYGEPIPGCSVKYCGVCPINEKPNISVETDDTTSQDLEETIMDEQGSEDKDVKQSQIIPESKLMASGNEFVFGYSTCRNKGVVVLFYSCRFIFYFSFGLCALGMMGLFLLNLFIFYEHYLSTESIQGRDRSLEYLT